MPAANGRQRECSARNPTIIITPPPTSSQISPENRKSVWNLEIGPRVWELWLRKFCNPSRAAAIRLGNMPNANSMAPNRIAVIADFVIGAKTIISAGGHHEQPVY